MHDAGEAGPFLSVWGTLQDAICGPYSFSLLSPVPEPASGMILVVLVLLGCRFSHRPSHLGRGSGVPSINDLCRITENRLSPIRLQNGQLEPFLAYVTSCYRGICKFNTEKRVCGGAELRYTREMLAITFVRLVSHPFLVVGCEVHG